MIAWTCINGLHFFDKRSKESGAGDDTTTITPNQELAYELHEPTKKFLKT